MVRLEDLTPGALVKGLAADSVAELVSVKWHGSAALEVVYRDSAGRLAGQPGAEVSVTLEIEARLPGGASEQLVRVITENCRTLKFTAQGFESE